MPPKRLLDQVREKIRLKHYAHSTEQSYVNWIWRFNLLHHKRHPSQMGVWKLERKFSGAAREWGWMSLNVERSSIENSQKVAFRDVSCVGDLRDREIKLPPIS